MIRILLSHFYLPFLNWKYLYSCFKVQHLMRFELVCFVLNGINPPPPPPEATLKSLCWGGPGYVGKWMVILSNKNEQITWKHPYLKKQKSDLCLTLRSVRWREKFLNRHNKLRAREKEKKIAYFLITFTLFKPTSFLVYNPLGEHIKKGWFKVCLKWRRIMK